MILPNPPISGDGLTSIWTEWFSKLYSYVKQGQAVTYLVGDPTTAILPVNTFGVFKNNTTGLIKLWANNGGVMQSVTLT